MICGVWDRVKSPLGDANSGIPAHSLLYFSGVAPKDIQEWLGHSDISTTSNIYTHLDYSATLASENAILTA